MRYIYVQFTQQYFIGLRLLEFTDEQGLGCCQSKLSGCILPECCIWLSPYNCCEQNTLLAKRSVQALPAVLLFPHLNEICHGDSKYVFPESKNK